MTETISFPMYQLSKGFRWRVEQLSPYNFVIAIEHPLVKLPWLSRRWRSTVAADFPEIDTQLASDLLEQISDNLAMQWMHDMQILAAPKVAFDKAVDTYGRTQIRLAARRMRRTPLLTTATTSWPDVSGAEAGAAEAASEPNPDEGWDA